MRFNKKICNSFLVAVIFVAGVLNGAAAWAKELEFWPGTDYDPNIPTVAQVLGYSSGDKVTSPGDVLNYFNALAQAAPERMVLKRYGISWEGRPLVYAVISSRKNMARLGDIQRGMQKLSDPRKTSDAEAEHIIDALPGTLWLSHSVHGNEISPADAAMVTAYHLLAAKNDGLVGQVLDNTVVLIDPLQNPDGRQRFVQHYESSRGLEPDSSVLSVEHNEPWARGRTNHYLFDMNRDWFALTQPESQARAKALLAWFPLVFADLHEMGSDGHYYFPPPAKPLNPHVTEAQWNNQEVFGRHNARIFDRFGFPYFTRHIFDNFYPGYGASWPAHFGAIAMTYEQGTALGLVIRRKDGSELTYRDGIAHHFVASLATAETVARYRKKLLQDFYRYRKTAIEDGKKGAVKFYILPRQFDQAATDKLAGLLTRQGIEVLEAKQSFKQCRRAYPAGSYVVNAAQPASRLIRNLLDPEVPIGADYLKKQEALRHKGYPGGVYDSVSAWSLPLMFNVRMDACGKRVKGDFSVVPVDSIKSGTVTNPEARVAFLVPWGQLSSIRLLSLALREGLTVKSVDKAFTNQGRKYPSGTLIFDLATNPNQLGDALQELAGRSGAEVVGIDDSWVTEGPNIGEGYGRIVPMAAPRVAMAWDEPSCPEAAGSTRFIIERQMDYPVTAIRTSQVAQADLSRFQVLILPDSCDQVASNSANYLAVLGERGIDNLIQWVEDGGTLLGMGQALNFLTDNAVTLLSVKPENAFVPEEDSSASDVGVKGSDQDQPAQSVKGSRIATEADLLKRIRPETRKPEYVPGALAKATVDQEHWLSAGVADELNVLVRGQNIYTPVSLDKGYNVVYFKGADQLLVSGHMLKESREQLAYKPFVVVEKRGRGHVIGFTQDPTFRAYLDGLNVIVANAIFRGAAHSSPVR